MRTSLINRRFDRLTVLEVIETKIPPSGKRSRLYKVRTRCDCGSLYDIWENALRQQKTSMCPKCRTAEKPIYRHPLASTWHGMHDRCYNQSSTHYRHYGGRGVDICEAWRKVDGDVVATRRAFWQFVEDMGEKPAGGTVERKDVNLGYSKENCVWATNSDQQLNKRTTPKVRGVPVAKLLSGTNCDTGRVMDIARKYGKPVEEVVNAAVAAPPGTVRWQKALGVPRRPKKPKEGVNIHTMRRHNFFLPVETVNQLKAVAEKRGVTTSEVIRQALEAWLKAYRKQQEAQHGR